MIGKRNVSVCSGHELANALYIYICEESTSTLSGEVVLRNTEVSTPPGAIVKVFTESGGHYLL